MTFLTAWTVKRMILPINTPGLAAALEYNAQVIAEGRTPESLGIPSIIDDEGAERLEAIMNGALIRELEERKRRDAERRGT